MSAIFHRTPGAVLPMAVGGDGVYLIDAEGRRYLDASGGAAVSSLGHGHPRVIEAIREQASKLAYAHTGFFTNAPAERLAERLIAAAPPGFGKVYFVSGGSEAVETALKLARACQLARGETNRRLFISRRQSYHGNTLGALGVSGNPGRRRPYESLLTPSVQIAPCYEYRERRADETAAEYGRRAADDLERAILEAGPEHVAAFIAEPIVGATLGACPAVPGYFARIREICNAYGVLFIADEVMAGMGRAGRLYAIEDEGVSPDIICLAKGLGAGYQPIGAAIASEAIHDTLMKTGFEHGHTYIGHATACAAALAVQEEIEDAGLLEKVAAREPVLKAALAKNLGPLDVVGDIRGRGLMIGVEFVASTATKTPFESAHAFASRLKTAALRRGLICYPGRGCVDGDVGDHVLLAPPFIADESCLENIAALLAAAVGDVLAVADAA